MSSIRHSLEIMFLFFLIANVQAQVSEPVKQELVSIATAFYNDNTIQGRLKYIRDAENHRGLLESFYSDGITVASSQKYGECTEKNGVYQLERIVEGSSPFRGTVEVKLIVWFIKESNDYKIDWDATVAYNPITWALFLAKKDAAVTRMRCIAALGDSILHDDYYCLKLYDEITNFKVSAYFSKEGNMSNQLMTLFADGKARRVLLDLKYVNLDRYSKDVVIENFVQQGWVIQ